MAYLTQRNGWQYVCFPDPATGLERRRSLKTKNKEIAENILKDYQAAERLDLLGIPSRNKEKNPLLSDLFAEYLIYSKKHKKPRTYRDDKSYIDNFLNPFFGNIRAMSLGNKHLEDFIGALKNWKGKDEKGADVEAPYHPRTINLRIGCLRAVLRRAKKNHDIPSLPVTIQHLHCPRPLPKYVTPDNFAKWVVEITRPINRYRAIIALCTSLADSDMAKLTWEANYDKEMGVIKYRRGKTTEDIVIMLNEWAKEIMAELYKIRNGPFIFHGVMDMRKAYWVASIKSGVKVSSHMLRHSFATWALSAGEPIAKIQLIMGHADIKTTQIYARVMPHFLQETTAAIDTMRPSSLRLKVAETRNTISTAPLHCTKTVHPTKRKKAGKLPRP